MIWKTLLNRFGAKESELAKVIAYLRHYGYLAGSVLDTVINISKAIADLRGRAGLVPDDTINDSLLSVIDRPRCGCLDVQRVATEQARWRKNKLKYFIHAYVNGISQADQIYLIGQAWKSWEGLADIQLTRVNTQVESDIVISTGKGQAQGFDGPSGTLAWAHLPPGNDQQLLMRFDIDESWAAGADPGIRYLNVAAHEFGHLLGLDHSKQSSALMAPFYSPAISKPQQSDDIPRIQALYGVKASPVPTPTPPTVPPVNPPAPPAGKKTHTITLEGDITSISIPGFKFTPI